MSNLQMKDANSATVSVHVATLADGSLLYLSCPADSTGAAITSVNPLNVTLPAVTAGAPLAVYLPANASGGGTKYKTISTASTNAVSLKGGPGKILSIRAYCLSGSTRYLKLYDKATAPTVGTDVPAQTDAVLASGGFVYSSDVGMDFSAGIAFAITAAAADNDNSAVTAGDVILNIVYK